MAHWQSNEVNAIELLKEFPKYATKDFAVVVTWKDLLWEGMCGYQVTITKPVVVGRDYGVPCYINFRICEQPGCCGCANLFYVHVSDYSYLQDAYDMAMWCARKLKLAYIKFAGTSEQSRLMDIFKRDGWHKAGSAPNGRYAERGNEIFVYTKKLNVIRHGRGTYPRKYGY